MYIEKNQTRGIRWNLNEIQLFLFLQLSFWSNFSEKHGWFWSLTSTIRGTLKNIYVKIIINKNGLIIILYYLYFMLNIKNRTQNATSTVSYVKANFRIFDQIKSKVKYSWVYLKQSWILRGIKQPEFKILIFSTKTLKLSTRIMQRFFCFIEAQKKILIIGTLQSSCI